MSKSKYVIALCAITSLHLFGQFMDPELSTPRSSSNVNKKDEFFPEIIPEHGKTERRVVVIEKDICIISNNVSELRRYVDFQDSSVEKTLREIVSNSVETLNAKIDSEKESLIETIDLRADQLDERINTVSGELSKKIENSTNEVLRVAKVYADQYANQAPGYAETQSKANAALPNTYNSMIGSDSFVRAVRDTIGEFPVVVKTLKSVDQRTGSSLPSTIIMSAGKDVIYYTGLTSDSFSLSFSNTDASEDGVYTWELMLSTNNDISGTTCGESVSYVGNDRVTNPSLAFKRIDNERTTHVFAVRLIKIGTVQKWMIAYNYSFKG